MAVETLRCPTHPPFELAEARRPDRVASGRGRYRTRIEYDRHADLCRCSWRTDGQHRPALGRHCHHTRLRQDVRLTSDLCHRQSGTMAGQQLRRAILKLAGACDCANLLPFSPVRQPCAMAINCTLSTLRDFLSMSMDMSSPARQPSTRRPAHWMRMDRESLTRLRLWCSHGGD